MAKGWRLACARAGITHLNFHDLRREFASRLLESGASEHDVRDFLGHANITTTSRYLQSSALRLERALAHMERSESRTTRDKTRNGTRLRRKGRSALTPLSRCRMEA